MSQTFFPRPLATMTNDQLNDLVSEWHAAAHHPEHPAHGMELHDWLGMSDPDYGRWVEDPKYRPADGSNFLTDDEIDDLIDEWHDATPGHPAHGTHLHEWLRMTWDEYKLWAENPGEWRRLTAAHRGNPNATS